MPDLTFRQLQEENAAWAARNFGPANYPERSLLGVVEEVGELAHAVLKGLQGIRGSQQEHQLAAKDAVGDVVIYLADFCTRSGFDFGECVQEAWDEVKARDWTKHRRDGTTA
jgi:NTP pyrophosphatase (non-canonical NTP hydrolase)